MRSLPLAMLAVMAVPTAAAAPSPKQRIEARQAGMKEIGRHFKAVNDAVRGGSPDAKALQAPAARLVRLSRAVPGWFARGTGPETGIKTAAKPDIWRDPAGFQRQARAFAAATTSLEQATRSGGDLRPAVAAIGKTCKGCHEGYSVPRK